MFFCSTPLGTFPFLVSEFQRPLKSSFKKVNPYEHRYSDNDHDNAYFSSAKELMQKHSHFLNT